MRHVSSLARHDLKRGILGLMAALLVAAGLAVIAPAPAFAAEAMSLTKSSADSVLVGGEVEIELVARNNGDEPEYNLGFRDELPEGVAYVPGSTTPAAIGEPTVVTDPGTGRQTLLWLNVSDLPVGAEQGLAFRVEPDPAVHPVGSRLDNVGQAYASSDPRTLPKFDGDGVYTTGASVQAVSSLAETDITAITVDKSEPSPEHELRRGVHAHSTVYTLTVTNNSRNPDEDVVLVDFLPAQLEFLGCGTADNTPGDAREYPGAARLDASTPDVAGCVLPTSVDTVEDPAGLPAGVYTRVEWDLGTLTAGEVVEIDYRAGIPQRANTMTFPGGRPGAASGAQGANLDNNTGAPTREIGEQALTNRTSVTATYTGPLAPGASAQVSDDDQLTVTAEDLAVQKSVSPGTFTHGGVATYTLDLQTGEYADATDIVLVDTIPNGLCPLDDTANHAGGAPSGCDPAAGFAPSVPFDSVVENPDGSFTVTFDPIDIAASGTDTVTYQARMLASYRGGSSAPTVAGDSYQNTVTLTGTTTTLAAVDAPGGVTSETVQDASSATLQSDTLALAKDIQPNDGPTPYACSADPASYDDADALTPAQTTFGEGDRVCFSLRVDFPAGNDTKNPVLTDFLPADLEYEAGSAQALTGNDVAVSVDETDLRFTLGTAAGSDRFVPRGSTFLYRISAVVTGQPRGEPDINGNLAKLTWTNTDGRVGFLRDQEDFSIAAAPPLGLVKSAERISAVAPGVTGPLADGGNPDATGRIRAGDVVEFTVAVTNEALAAQRNDVPAVGPDVWDVLPAGISCADVSAISAAGVCTDPGDAAHPTFSERDDRAAIRWDRPDTVTIAPGDTLELTYRVTYPAAVATGGSYRNDAAVASYSSETNQGDLAEHHPADNVDTTVPAEEIDAPAADDDHTLLTPGAGVTKTNVTSVSDAAQGPNGSASYATIGETVTFTIRATIPAHTTVYAGELVDLLPSGFRLMSASLRFRSDASGPYTSLPPGMTLQGPPQPKVVFPAVLDAGAADDQVELIVSTVVVSHAANTHGATRTNRARLSSQDQAGDALPVVQATSVVTIAEPAPSLTKVADETAPRAGESVDYTLTARNRNDADPAQQRPTLHEARLVDCVPAGLVVRAASLVATQGTATVEAVGSNGCAADRAAIVWEVDDLPWRSAADAAGASPWPTLDYTVDVSPAAGGGQSYTNLAALTGTSMNGSNADEKSYTASTDETVTVPGGALTKSVDPARVPVGDTTEYTVEVDLPRDVNFYEASVVDELPAGIDPASVALTGSSCEYADVLGGACGVTADPGSELAPQGQLHGWFLGDVASDPRARTVTLTYTAVVGVVAGNTAGTTLTNSARLKWNLSDSSGTPAVDDTFDAQTDPGTATVTVTEPSLSITKTVSEATPEPGETFTYTVRVTNATGANVSTAHDVDLTDTIPAGVQVVGSPSDGGVAAGGTPGGGTITWDDLGPIAAGGFVELTYTGRLVTPAPSSAQVNVADITEYTSLDDTDGSGRTYDGPEAEATVTAALPVIEVDKVVLDAPPAYLGEPTSWQVTVTNSGPATAYDVDVEDVLPSDWTYEAGSARISVAGAPAAAREPDTATGSPVQTLTWDDLGDLATGESIVITLAAVPGAALAPDDIGSGTAQVNEATATAQDLDGPAGSVVTTDDDTAQTRIDEADLTLLKEAVGTPVAGEQFTWRITVSNDGPDRAVGPFTVTDDLPTQVTGASATGTGWSCSTGVDEVTCERDDATDGLDSGDSFPVIELTATVPADLVAGTRLDNEATVEARTYETDPTDNTDDVSVDVVAVSDMGIVKRLVGDLVPGASATYTLSVSNAGPSVSRGPITVTDTLPAGLTLDSWSGAGWSLARSGQELTFTWDGTDPVAVGALPQISIVVDVDSGVDAPVVNTAEVAEPTDPTTGPEEPDSSTVTTPPAPSADLALTKTSPGAFKAGTEDVYLLEVDNLGPSDAQGTLTISDTLPVGLSYVSVTSDEAWSCSATGRDVTCTLPDTLVAGASSTVRLRVAIGEDVTGDLLNEATVSGPTPDPNPGNDSDTDDTGVSVEADLVVTKDLVTSPVVAGERVTYEVAVRNAGPATSPGPIVVTDRLPDELELVSVSGSGWTCTGTRDLECERAAALGAGIDAPVITVVAQVASSAGPVALVNSANVSGPATDPTPSNNTDTATATITEDTEIVVAKSVEGSGTVRAGEDATFTVVVTNDGPSDALDVSVSDVLPAGMTLVSVSGTGWSCTGATCTRDRITAGQSAPDLTVVAEVGSGVPDGTVLTNQVSVSTVTPGDTPAGNEDDADVTVAAEADLALEKTHATGTAVSGTPTDFEIQVRNLGPSDAVGPIEVRDQLPGGMSFLAASAPWTCLEGAELVCTLDDDLAAGLSAPVLSLRVMVDAAVSSGDLTNTATVGSSTTDPVPGNDTDTAEVTVSTLADLSVTKSHTGPVRVGDELSFTLEVANDGPSEARDVVLADTLPTGLEAVSATGAGWTCDISGQDVSCVLDAPLAPGTSAAPVTVVVTVTPAAYPSVDNVATVTSSTPEGDPSDNESTDPVEVPPLVDLSIEKSLQGELVVGEEATYTLLVANAGPTAAPGPITVTDTLPEGLAGVSAQGDGWTCEIVDDLVTCTSDDELGVGEESTIEVVVEVLPAAYPSVLNTADVSSPAEDEDPGNDTSSDDSPVTPTVDLELEKSVESSTATRAVYSLTVTNNGPSATVDPVRVRDRLPASLRLVEAGGKGWSCTTQPRLLTCLFADPIAAGDSATIRLTTEIVADEGTEITNVGVVDGGGADGPDRDDAVLTVPDSGTGDGSGGFLPDTGGPAFWLWLLAAGLTASGALLLVRRRRLVP